MSNFVGIGQGQRWINYFQFQEMINPSLTLFLLLK